VPRTYNAAFAMPVESGTIYSFGPFRLEIDERRLLQDGQTVPLRTKVFDTLCVLVGHSGRLLTKHELMESLWPDAVVEENNLNHNISTLRRALGEKATGQQYIETVPRVGYRFVAGVTQSSGRATQPGPAPTAKPERSLRQEIRFATASDGVRIAYSTAGDGPPLVKAANWLNHLEFEWESPVWRHWIHAISRHHRFVRYDERGCGLSDWQVPELSFESWVRDLETVVDAQGLDRFALLGISQGGPVAATYAVRHPERVSHRDAVVPFDEGRMLAAGIPGARFVPLPSRNHLLVEDEPGWTLLLDELAEFLGWEH